MSDDNSPKSSGAQVLGIDQMEHFNAYVGALNKHLDANREANRAKAAEEKARNAYQVVDTVYMHVRKREVHGWPVYDADSDPVSMPDPSMSVSFRNWTQPLEDLLHETRFLFAEALYKARVEKTWEEAKLRASRCKVEMANMVHA